MEGVVNADERLAYWTEHLAGVPTLQLPTDYPRPQSHKVPPRSRRRVGPPALRAPCRPSHAAPRRAAPPLPCSRAPH